MGDTVKTGKVSKKKVSLLPCKAVKNKAVTAVLTAGHPACPEMLRSREAESLSKRRSAAKVDWVFKTRQPPAQDQQEQDFQLFKLEEHHPLYIPRIHKASSTQIIYQGFTTHNILF